ncbi:penton protein [Human adenovirus 12]|uniref:Penton protein n=3 Tax=Human adenovirus A serotype 12 TaxID=28282 RepID=CAPSP_ADE12|nr:penton base [Human mastadenovirus A]AP_000116.1 III [Human mastadenovirus A]P36716.1 RecName: Full=Penton protein; Short=CP-P; AltName: Full=Penton base protein; AltName: Full=Protein III [Human adenovirus 12]CAA51887.1 penton protein [Human adenovirus 12]prf//2017341A penton base protein [Human adenovirus 12]
MRRAVELQTVAFPETPPPSYETVMAAAPPYVPPRYLGPTEGRNSIRYSELSPLYDTTRVYLVDNKSSDIASLNYQNDHSNFLTTVVQNNDYSPIEAGTQTINFDERSRWGGDLKTILHTNMPNVNDFMFTTKFKARVMVARKTNNEGQTILEYEWAEFVLPEGNYSETMTIDLMNNAIIEHYLRVGRQHGVLESDIGVKFDTRNFRLGWDPETQLVTPGVYTNEAFHPDIVLLPGCGVDFTESRLSNILGIRKRQPFQEGFVIMYEHLEGGNIPALLDVKKYENSLQDQNTVRGDNFIALNKAARIEPVETDPKGRSYNLLPDKKNTKYRSWYLAYNYGDPEKGVRSWTLLTTPDVTGGSEQVYWSLPDMMQDPVTFRSSRQVSNYPVVAAELLPVHAKSFYNEQAVYSQLIRQSTALTRVFNRFPENQILVRPPAATITTVSENVPALTDHGTLPLRSSISGVQRVTITDARRRTCPYVYKALGIVSPRVLSSRTF